MAGSILQCAGPVKKVKNVKLRVYAASCSILMFRDWMCKFFAEYQSSQTWWRLGDTPTLAGYFLQGPGPVKNPEFTAHVVFYPIVGAGTGYPIF